MSAREATVSLDPDLVKFVLSTFQDIRVVFKDSLSLLALSQLFLSLHFPHSSIVYSV